MKILFSLLSSLEKKVNHVICTILELSFIEFHEFIQKNNWSPYIFKDNYRSKKNFKAAYVIALDFDGGYSVTQAILKLKELGLQYSLTFTRNHQKEKNGKAATDRFRIVIPLERPITNLYILKKILDLTRKHFPESDPQCFDEARMFYASDSTYNESNSILSLEGSRLIPEHHLKETLIDSLISDKGTPQSIKHFILNPIVLCEENKWNESLNKTVYFLARNGWSLEKINMLYKEFAPNPDDPKDIVVIKSAYSSGAIEIQDIEQPLKSRYLAGYNLLKIELKNIYFIQSKEGITNILLANENDEVRYIHHSLLKKMITVTFTEHEFFKTTSDVKNQLEYFIDQSPSLLNEPKLITFKSSNELSFKKLDFDPKEGDCPLFLEFLSRCTNAQAYSAFIWSIFEPLSDLQQYIWMLGDGQNGKGANIRLLARLLGDTFCTETSRGNQEDKHLTSNFIGKRAVIFPDNNDKKLPTTDIFKTLTGNDPVKINAKFQAPYTKKLDLKILVFSNKEPLITTQSSDQRRAIICQISPITVPPSSDYDERLWDERSAILSYCKKAYENLTIKHGKIECDQDIAKFYGEQTEGTFELIFEELFFLDKASYVTPNDLLRSSHFLCKEYQISFGDFKSWLMRRHLLVEKRDKNRKIYGIGLKNHTNHPNLLINRNSSNEI